MTVLILGVLLFLGLHSIRIVADGWRTAQIARMGGKTWKGIFSLLSLLGFGLIVWGFSMARLVPVIVWVPPLWTRHLAALLMLAAFILLVAAYVPGNHFKSRIGHPMLAATKIWALAHLMANGMLADVVLFAPFLVWAIVDFAVSRRRDRALGVRYAAHGIGRDVVTVGLGAVAWAFFAHYGHMWLIGVRPFG